MRARSLLLLLLAGAAPVAAGENDIVLAPSAARPGDAVLVRVKLPPADPGPSGTLAGRRLQFWRNGREMWAVAALPIETPPGSVAVELVWGALDMARSSSSLKVMEPGFPSRTLRVAPKFVEPPPPKIKARILRDRRAFDAAYARPFAPPLFSESFGWPRRDRTGGRYGDQRVFNCTKASGHYGLDIDGPRGAPVQAANDGEVVLARACFYSGNTVVLWHGADLFTLYFHLDRMDVRAGAKVKKGDPLGVIGSTGRVTGPHLHWQVRASGLYVDPESLLGIDFATGAAPPRHAGPPAPEPRDERPAPPPPPETVPAPPAPDANAAAPPR